MKISAPSSPREVLQLLSEYKESEGIEGLFERVDWSTSTAEQIKSAFLVLPSSAKSVETTPIKLAETPKELALSAIQSIEFQANLIPFVAHAFPENLRLSFVHIPKCGGTTVNTLLGAKFPWLNDHVIDPAWTTQNKLFKILRNFAHKAQKSNVLFFSCHRNIRWFLAQGIHRAEDRMFTIIRHPYDIVFSQINYMFKRFREDPLLTTPDTRDWAQKIDLDRHESGLDSANAKTLAIKLFDNPHLIRRDLLTTYLGEQNVSSALRDVKQSKIEIINLDSLDQWLETNWNITAKLRDNRSESILSIAELDDARTESLIDGSAEEVAFYEYLMKVLVSPRQSKNDAHSLGQNASIANLAPAISVSASEMVSTFYRAVLNREPNPEGLRKHVDSIEKGRTLQSVLGSFVKSKEFRKKFASDPTVFKFLISSERFVKNFRKELDAVKSRANVC